MKLRSALAATVAAAALLTSAGCAVIRGQETTGAYIDDAAITTAVKAKFVENKDVDAASIKVETMKEVAPCPPNQSPSRSTSAPRPNRARPTCRTSATSRSA